MLEIAPPVIEDLWRVSYQLEILTILPIPSGYP
jgi:hypothetical protein